MPATLQQFKFYAVSPWSDTDSRFHAANNNYHPYKFLGPRYHANVFVAVTVPRTPLRRPTVLSSPHSWI